MNRDKAKSIKEEPISELEFMRQRVAGLEKLEAKHKQEHEALKEHNNRLSNIFSSLKDLVFVLDKEGRFTEFYVPGEELYLPPEGFIGKKHSEVMPPHVYKLFSKAFEKNKNGEVDEYEYSLDIAGREQWYSAKQSPLFTDGQFSGAVAVIRNITKHKQLDEQIKESEERYRALVDLGGKVGEAVVMMQDTDKGEGIQTFVSDEWSRITGYSKEELLGMSFFGLLSPRDRKASLDRHRKKVNGESMPDHFEMSVIRKDGTEVPIELTSAYTTYQGKRANVAYISDITERKQVEEKIQQQNIFLNTTLESLAHPFYVINTHDYTIALANSATGFKSASKKTTCHSITHHSDKPCQSQEHPCPLEIVKKTKKPTVLEHIHFDKNGNARKYEVRGYPIFDSKRNVIQMIEYCLDITERAQAQEKHKAIIETTADGFWMVDLRGRLLDVNESYCKMLGYTREELLKLSISDIEAIETPEETIQHIKDLRNQGYTRFETRHKRKDGKLIDIDVSANYLDIGKGLIFVFVRDITERKLMEQELKHYHAHLKELVAKRTTELVKTNKQLQEQIEQRIEFTRALVHELKTPLTPLLGASEAFANQPLEKPYQNLAKNIYIGARQLNRRIDELLDLARSEIGKLKVSCKPLDPLGLIHKVAEEMSQGTIKKNQSLVLEMPSSLPLVSADEDRLQQIIINLLSNAFKFTPEGGMITLKTKEKDNSLIIEVQDTGPGIVKHEQQRLFQPYYRLESDRERLSGLGLGLALSKTLVELQQGEIWVKSQKGRGSTFGFSIPLVRNNKLKRDMKKETSNEDSSNRG